MGDENKTLPASPLLGRTPQGAEIFGPPQAPASLPAKPEPKAPGAVPPPAASGARTGADLQREIARVAPSVVNGAPVGMGGDDAKRWLMARQSGAPVVATRNDISGIDTNAQLPMSSINWEKRQREAAGVPVGPMEFVGPPKAPESLPQTPAPAPAAKSGTAAVPDKGAAPSSVTEPGASLPGNLDSALAGAMKTTDELTGKAGEFQGSLAGAATPEEAKEVKKGGKFAVGDAGIKASESLAAKVSPGSIGTTKVSPTIAVEKEILDKAGIAEPPPKPKYGVMEASKASAKTWTEQQLKVAMESGMVTAGMDWEEKNARMTALEKVGGDPERFLDNGKWTDKSTNALTFSLGAARMAQMATNPNYWAEQLEEFQNTAWYKKQELNMDRQMNASMMRGWSPKYGSSAPRSTIDRAEATKNFHEGMAKIFLAQQNAINEDFVRAGVMADKLDERKTEALLRTLKIKTDESVAKLGYASQERIEGSRSDTAKAVAGIEANARLGVANLEATERRYQTETARDVDMFRARLGGAVDLKKIEADIINNKRQAAASLTGALANAAASGKQFNPVFMKEKLLNDRFDALTKAAATPASTVTPAMVDTYMEQYRKELNTLLPTTDADNVERSWGVRRTAKGKDGVEVMGTFFYIPGQDPTFIPDKQ